MKQTPRAGNPWRNRIRLAVAGLLVAAGSLGFGAYVVVNWAERQILNTENWVALVSPLPQQPVVSTALGSYIGTQVFAAAPIEARIAEALPPRASFLAGPLTDQLRTLTVRASQRIVASDQFQSVWTAANRIAMNRLLTTAREDERPLQSKVNQKFDIDLSEAGPKVRAALGRAAEAIPALQPVSQKALVVSADVPARPNQLREVVRTTDSLAAILPLFIATAVLGALALSYRRSRTGQVFVVIILFLLLCELIAINWLRQTTLDQVRVAAYEPAIAYIYDTIVAWLQQMIYNVLAVLAVIFGLLLLAGPSKWAVALRSKLRIDRLGATRLAAKWRQARVWVKKRQYYLWLGVGLVVLISLAFLETVDNLAIINAVLLILGFWALIHIIATPRART